MKISKTVVRKAVVPFTAGGIVLVALFAHPIIGFLAYEGSVIADLRLMRAQASLAVIEGLTGGSQDPVADHSVPAAAPVRQ